MNVKIDVVKTKEVREVDSFLVDVPVTTNIWVRPACQRAQFDVIRQAKPSTLFLQSDGGRNEHEWEIIQQSRTMFEEKIDWDCTIHYLYADKNYGLYTMNEYTRSYIWQHTDRCIFLEDDHIPSVCFFEFCKELLDKYQDDLRICAICGFNYTGVSEKCTSDYLFSRNLAIWGIACWRRTFETSRINYSNDEYTIEAISRLSKSDWFRKAVHDYASGKLSNGHIPGPEFYLNLNVKAQNQLFIYPKYNMISCWGVAPGSAHTVDSIEKLPKGVAQLYYMKTYEVAFPLKHPYYVFPDIEFERKQNRIMGYQHPFVSAYRKAISICKRVWFGDGVSIMKESIRRFRMKKREY